jgi:hypothetical protein
MLKMSYLSKHYPSTPELAPLLEQDTDGDGKTGQEELNAGTSPTDNSSVFRMLQPVENGGDLTLSWSSVPGKFYTVYSRADLSTGEWTPMQPQQIPADASGTTTFAVTKGSGKAFYRVETTP